MSLPSDSRQPHFQTYKMKTVRAVLFLFIAAIAGTTAFGEEIDNKAAHAIKTVDSYVLSWQYTENPYSAKTPPSLKLAAGDIIKLRFHARPVSTANDDGSVAGAIYESGCPGSIYFKVPNEGVKWFNKLINSGSRQARYAFCRVTNLKEKIELEMLGRELSSGSKTSTFIW